VFVTGSGVEAGADDPPVPALGCDCEPVDGADAAGFGGGAGEVGAEAAGAGAGLDGFGAGGGAGAVGAVTALVTASVVEGAAAPTDEMVPSTPTAKAAPGARSVRNSATMNTRTVCGWRRPLEVKLRATLLNPGAAYPYAQRAATRNPRSQNHPRTDRVPPRPEKRRV
jgi:hypothetical protein